MSTGTWHLDPAALEEYLGGRLDALAGASVEQHLMHCGDCRAAVAPLVEAPALDLVWDRIEAVVHRPELPAPIRLARRMGLTEPASILLTSAASMRTAWLSSTVVALGFAFVASKFSDGGVLWPFLVVAPLVPAIGVAVSYGSAAESLESLVTTTPYGRTRLIMVRTLAVLVTCLPLAFLLSLLLPGPLWVAAAWLGPAMAMIPVMMAIASFVGPRPAAAAVAVLWSGLVIGAVRRLPETWPVEVERQLVFVLLAAVACVVLAVRARSSHPMGDAL
jgi:hypothetical protein